MEHLDTKTKSDIIENLDSQKKLETLSEIEEINKQVKNCLGKYDDRKHKSYIATIVGLAIRLVALPLLFIDGLAWPFLIISFIGSALSGASAITLYVINKSYESEMLKLQSSLDTIKSKESKQNQLLKEAYEIIKNRKSKEVKQMAKEIKKAKAKEKTSSKQNKTSAKNSTKKEPSKKKTSKTANSKKIKEIEKIINNAEQNNAEVNAKETHASAKTNATKNAIKIEENSNKVKDEEETER